MRSSVRLSASVGVVAVGACILLAAIVGIRARSESAVVRPARLDVDNVALVNYFTLAAGPDPLVYFPSTGAVGKQVTVDNRSGKDPLQWTASAPASWLTLGQTSGTTPAAFTASVDADALGPGAHETTITLTSNDVPEQTLELNVIATVQQPHRLYIPAITVE